MGLPSWGVKGDGLPWCRGSLYRRRRRLRTTSVRQQGNQEAGEKGKQQTRACETLAPMETEGCVGGTRQPEQNTPLLPLPKKRGLAAGRHCATSFGTALCLV